MTKRRDSKPTDADVLDFEVAAKLKRQDAVRAQVLEVVEKDGETRRSIAKQMGVTHTVLSSWLHRKYKGDNDKVTRMVEQWLAHRRAQGAVEAGLPDEPGFVLTDTAETIVTTLEWAQVAGDLVVVYGAPGVGKTETLKWYAETRPSVWRVTATPSQRSVFGILVEVADELGVLGGGTISSTNLHRLAVRAMHGTRGLLIIDEAQHLTVRALEALRALHDATGVGLALVGNESVYSRLSGKQRAATFAQLFSRVGRRVRFRRAKKEDVLALADAWKITGRKQVDILCQIALQPGGLRAVSKSIRLASMLAAGAGAKEIYPSHLSAAYRELGGEGAHA